jgi:hypothetical protein
MIRHLSVIARPLFWPHPPLLRHPRGGNCAWTKATNAADPDNVPDVKFRDNGQRLSCHDRPGRRAVEAGRRSHRSLHAEGPLRLVRPSGHTNY